ncbi:hypothetical protein [Paraflavitalea speifideaquila]|uniref:hypothetical protein n=1 Tax=Paraflavitalea speifideaquila TaxID=3076558 RepID=UPI0028E806C5|nr:hypothetical protein [Paraflavitalea speifideiaquila]
MDKNTVKFRVANYSKTSTLVIDPTLVFCSFTGSSADQYGYTATPGPDGSLFSGALCSIKGFLLPPALTRLIIQVVPVRAAGKALIWAFLNSRPMDNGLMPLISAETGTITRIVLCVMPRATW